MGGPRLDYFALRPMTVGATTYAVGDVVDVSAMTNDTVTGLMRSGYLASTLKGDIRSAVVQAAAPVSPEVNDLWIDSDAVSPSYTTFGFDAHVLRVVNTGTGAVTEATHVNANRFMLPFADGANLQAVTGNGIVLPSSWSSVRLVAMYEVSAQEANSFVCWGVHQGIVEGGSTNGVVALTSQTVSANVTVATLQRLVLGTVDVTTAPYWKFGFRRQGSDVADTFTGNVFLHSLLVEKV